MANISPGSRQHSSKPAVALIREVFDSFTTWSKPITTICTVIINAVYYLPFQKGGLSLWTKAAASPSPGCGIV